MSRYFWKVIVDTDTSEEKSMLAIVDKDGYITFHNPMGFRDPKTVPQSYKSQQNAADVLLTLGWKEFLGVDSNPNVPDPSSRTIGAWMR